MGDSFRYFYWWISYVYMETIVEVFVKEINDKINARAYDIYEARLYWNMPGDQLSDWLQAEAEINHAITFHTCYGITEEVQNEISNSTHSKGLTCTGY